MLTVVERVLVLARGSLGDAPTSALARLAAAAEEETLAAGATLWGAGAVADALVVILDGEIALRDGKQEIARVRAGELVDPIATVLAERRASRAVAARRSTVLRIPRDELWRLLAEEGGLARSLLQTVARSVTAAATRLANLATGR